MAKYKKAICWLRRDLRLDDHMALYRACEEASKVILIFVFDTQILNKLHDKADRRIQFIHDTLKELNTELKKQSSSLLILHGDPVEEIPQAAKKLNAEAVFTNRDYAPYALIRDRRVAKKLDEINCDFVTSKDQVIFEGLEVQTDGGDPYKVFTPYKKKWLTQLTRKHYAEMQPNLKKLVPPHEFQKLQAKWELKDLGFTSTDLWLQPGVSGARVRLKEFTPKLKDYANNRNHPYLEHGTSGLSVHLRFGTISIRELIRFCMQHRSKGQEVWLSELIWRDFYQMLLLQFPESVNKSFKPKYQYLNWPGKDEHFQAWCEGQTGYPIVDAAMRHFNQTGWMHNRLRMVVASFLTKDLLVHWKRGERYFARFLLDYDLAANVGGWQWAASTGCDAQPYFRIFNPVSQSEKFDPKGHFIKSALPELKDFSERRIHFPADADVIEQREAQCVIGKDYPAPIVIHKEQRQKALQLFKSV